jgi:thiamine-phosphate pyrophosphorylase
LAAKLAATDDAHREFVRARRGDRLGFANLIAVLPSRPLFSARAARSNLKPIHRSSPDPAARHRSPSIGGRFTGHRRNTAMFLEQARHARRCRHRLSADPGTGSRSRGALDLGREVVILARGSSTRVVVNDRLDVAIACGAAGVHLRADSVRPDAVRRAVPGTFVVGASVHTLAEAVAAAPSVDYIVAGTVWPTESKPSAATIGLEGLARIAAAVGVPVLAIGGVTLERLADTARSARRAQRRSVSSCRHPRLATAAARNRCATSCTPRAPRLTPGIRF